MTLTISLPVNAERRLRERGRATGQSLHRYVELLLTNELVAPLKLAQAAEPIARAVDAANVADDEFSSALLEARDAVRRGRDRQ